MKRLASKIAVMALVVAAFSSPLRAAEVNLYSERQPFLIDPLIAAFTAKTGIKVNAVYIKKGIVERLRAEGDRTPANVVLTTQIGNLQSLVQEGLILPVKSPVLQANVPPQYRDTEGRWYGLTLRARVIYAHKDRVGADEVKSFADLAKPYMKGRICTRSGKHAYNIDLIASRIAIDGVEKTESWLRGVKDNLARRPQGNDRAQVKAIHEGECDVSIGNTYYMGKMATNEKDPEQIEWANSVRIVFPDQDGSGTHVNVSGGALTHARENRDAAIRFLEFLTSDSAQKIYAENNFEYPVKPGVALHPMVASWGEYKADTTPMSEIAAHRAEASRMVDRVNFDN
ncbi:MAG: Fe(3+) ABC transporter substrate-binding protein [Rhodospirillales bacterium]|nr:Fe(3+) ABC transporter substrate-binding protein [Rhodospirillales bacterium]MCW8952610.1 Fe(3+) ABC transporter substrate-binding protein [Rhodospirillales bacterium]MCW9040464.1 Fe(3+) ABC transporter substrate-binding protein [Rhodospirillales bacterium]